MERTKIKIGEKIYEVLVAESDDEKRTGLSEVKELPENEGMLFVYDTPEDLVFTMADTSIDLDIIFLDYAGDVISVHSVNAGDKEPIEEEDALFVLEVNINSGIKVGDEMEEIEDEPDNNDHEPEKQDDMLVLDANGDVLYTLESGERIISRVQTRQLINLAIKAYKSDSDVDYRAVGRKVFKILDGLDSRDPEFVQKEEKE